MKTWRKRMSAWLVALVMVVSLLPAAYAVDAYTTLTWTLVLKHTSDLTEQRYGGRGAVLDEWFGSDTDPCSLNIRQPKSPIPAGMGLFI